MSTPLIAVEIALTKLPSVKTSTGAAYASTSVVVTDSTGVAQPAVVLTPGTLSFTANVAPGAGTVVATDLDVNGSTLATLSQTFTEAGSPPMFTPTGGITVTPVTATAASAALKK